jgi:hypothetical protein
MAAKDAEELNSTNEGGTKKRRGIQHTNVRLGKFLKDR